MNVFILQEVRNIIEIFKNPIPADQCHLRYFCGHTFASPDPHTHTHMQSVEIAKRTHTRKLRVQSSLAAS